MKSSERKQSRELKSMLRIAVLGAFMSAALTLPQMLNPLSEHYGKALASHTPLLSLTLAQIAALSVPTTVPSPYTLGAYVSGPPAASGSSPANTLGEIVDATLDVTAANALDHRWVQILDTTPVIWDLGSPSNTALIFPAVDHTPVPYESLEFTVWGSNDPNAPFPSGWTLGTLTRVYQEGWVDSGAPLGDESDDNASLWAFAGTFRYIAVYSNKSTEITPEPVGFINDCVGEGVFCSRDAEIDAVGRPTAITIALDIHPTSCPNPLNIGSQGLLPAAILGTSSFDVNCIDLSTILLEGVAPKKLAFEDVATPFTPFSGRLDRLDCTTDGPDGFLDLTLKFDTQAIVAALGSVSDKQVLVLHLTANLKASCGGGSPLVGEDVVVILKKKK
ncbi:MAG: hypothetical protein AABO57_17795 [Acidobacteriota bacterium]